MYSTYQIYLSMVVNKTATLYASIFGQISAAKTNVIFMENKKKKVKNLTSKSIAEQRHVTYTQQNILHHRTAIGLQKAADSTKNPLSS